MNDQFTFFFGGPFSNWYPSVFTFHGVTFCCAEQYMMYSKAMLFGDQETALRIMATAEPREQKRLGRLVRGFVVATWEAKAEHLVYVGLREKFAQNPALKRALLATGSTVIVEASPYDCIWGIGLGANDPRALDKAQWRGRNWLGFLLTRLRDAFRSDQSGFADETPPRRSLRTPPLEPTDRQG